MNNAKTCTNCCVVKPATAEFFYMDRGRLATLCKACRKSKSSQYRQDNHEKVLEWQKRFRQEQGERHREQGRRSYHKNAESRKSRVRNYRKANLELVKSRSQARYKANPEVQRARARAYEARKRNSGGRHTADDIRHQFSAQSGRCFYCREILVLEVGNKNKFHVDHYIPLVRNGSNGPENIVCACPTCNTAKSGRLPDDFLIYLQSKK